MKNITTNISSFLVTQIDEMGKLIIWGTHSSYPSPAFEEASCMNSCKLIGNVACIVVMEEGWKCGEIDGQHASTPLTAA